MYETSASKINTKFVFFYFINFIAVRIQKHTKFGEERILGKSMDLSQNLLRLLIASENFKRESLKGIRW